MAKAKDKKDDEVLTAGTEPEPVVSEPSPEEPTVDKKINAVGTDVPTVEKPVAAKVEKPKAELTVEDLRYGMRTLASMTLGPADFAHLCQLQPRVFGE